MSSCHRAVGPSSVALLTASSIPSQSVGTKVPASWERVKAQELIPRNHSGSCCDPCHPGHDERRPARNRGLGTALLAEVTRYAGGGPLPRHPDRVAVLSECPSVLTLRVRSAGRATRDARRTERG